MKKKLLLLRLVVLVTAMMCALGAAAAEAYANYAPSNTTLTFYYDNYRSSRTGTTYDLNTGNYSPGWYTDGTYSNVSEVKFDPSFTNARPTTCHSWFRDMAQLQTIYGLNYLNTSAVTHMVSMFRGCSSLTVLDLSSFSTANVIAMGGMFMGCSNLRTIYAGSGWSTAAVEASAGMFSSCTSLVGGQGTTFNSSHVGIDYAHIDGGPSNPGYFTEKGPEAYACYTPSNTTLTFYYDSQRSSRTGTTYDLNTGSNDTGWDTDGTKSNVTKVVFDPSFANARPTTTCDWFYGMTNLESITGLSYLNTSEVTNMAWMFGNCTVLTSLDVSHFNTSKVTDMTQMFYYCTGLTNLDLSNFNTSKVTNMSAMFYCCDELQTIYVGNGWSTATVTESSDMFFYCISLVGGQGTAYSSSNPRNKTYAHIDGGPNNPGYFTEKGTEAYACYTPSNTTLTFYYDTQRSSRTGTTYDLNTGSNDTGWDTDGTKSYVTKVVFDPSFAGARPTTTCDWFYSMGNLQSITGMSYLNTSEVTNMAYMFMWCTSLTSLDLSHFNTSNVKSMYGMFAFCDNLTSLDLSNWNTSKVTDMYKMFANSSHLQTIYVGNGWSTVAVTYSSDMFTGCTSLVGGQGTTYNASHVDKTYAHIDGGPSNPGYFTEWKEAYACYTPSNTTLTFYYDSQRSSRTGTTYDLNTGNTDVAWDTDGTNANVTKVVFDPSFAGARPVTTYDWFYDMTNLQSITGMSYLNTSEVTNMAWMFTNCKKLTSLDVSHFNTAKVTNMVRMFNSCSGLTSLDLSSFNTANVTGMSYMFNGCSGLTSLDLSSFNTANVTGMNYMFNGCTNLQTIYVGNGWSTAAVTQSVEMFKNCTSLVGGQGTTYNASHVDKTYAHIDGGTSDPGYFTAAPEAYACYTSSNTTLTFYYDDQRSSRPGTTCDLNTGSNDPGWRTGGINANVTKVVFDPSFADARPTTTYNWFYYMANLQSITGMSNLNTSEVTNMAFMFYGCNQLTSIDLSHFNTSQVTDMSVMFYGCSSLTSLDLGSFNTSQVTNMTHMFRHSNNLRTIYVGNGWSTAAVTASDYMFYNCTSLVGGQGTTYSSSNPMDKTYAHIDGGTSNPGYFTDKNAALRGDVNGDGQVKIDDVTALINLLLSGNTSAPAADCNLDGKVAIGDVTALINYLLSSTW